MLEYIVRPFQAPNAHGTIVIPSTPKDSAETAILTWGGESTLPGVQYTEVGFQFASCKENNVEMKRESEEVRIVGNDGESYIVVDRTNKLFMKKYSEKPGPGTATGQSYYAEGGDSGFGSFAPSPLFDPAFGQKESCAVTMSLNNNTTPAA